MTSCDMNGVSITIIEVFNSKIIEFIDFKVDSPFWNYAVEPKTNNIKT